MLKRGPETWVGNLEPNETLATPSASLLAARNGLFRDVGRWIELDWIRRSPAPRNSRPNVVHCKVLWEVAQKKGRTNEIVASALGRFSNLDPEESFFLACSPPAMHSLANGQGPVQGSGHYPAVFGLVLSDLFFHELLVPTT